MSFRQDIVLTLLCVSCALYSGFSFAQESVFMGTGIKMGEVTSSSAVIWTRLTKIPEPDPAGRTFANLSQGEFLGNDTITDEQKGPAGGYAFQLPEGVTLAEVEGAVPGTTGEVRLTLVKKGEETAKKVIGWSPVDGDRDFTRHFTLDGLKPATEYSLLVEGRKNDSSPVTATVKSSFATAADKSQPQQVLFTVVTGTRYGTRDAGEKGHLFFPSMLKLEPNFFVHTGDIVYYDHPDPFVTHIDLARFSWSRMFGLPNTREFHNAIPTYFMKDDHDSLDNDCWPSMTSQMGLFTYEQGLQVYSEQVPMSDKKHYRTFRWGKDLQIWLAEVRDYRSPNHEPDGPDKTMWGKEQIDWFKRTVNESDATFKVLISPTPMVGPDHLWKADKSDNHADKMWSHEGDMLREFISEQDNMYVICGDRHWQYISKHEKTGLLEYSCGPSTDAHATAMANPDRSMHLYYRPNGGFLSVAIDRVDGVPTATFRHHAVTGEVCNEHVSVAEE